MDDSAPRRDPSSDGDGESSDDRMARERRETSDEDMKRADDASYTARPSDEHPEEGGSTRDHDDEAVERSGSDG